ncbi:MAG TPA: MFS transporter, partial [Propionibacteriaceae bacterium]|nr:MFS transporter [Propionibacteriaceae bacterium]
MARLPLSMTGIGIVLLVSLTTGSFGQAGLLIAVVTLTAAVVAPLWGRAIDRVGQARVLLLAALINNVSLAVLIVAVERAWPLAVSVVAAAGVGAGFTLAGSAVRARWTLRLNGTPLLNTAFALEAMLDEVVFIV